MSNIFWPFMEQMFIALVILNILIVALVILCFWQMYRSHKLKKSLRDFNKKIKQDRSKLVELELATTQQIVHELVRRPNLKFLMLMPHTKDQENLYVEIHSSNVPLPMALGMLRATYQGVIDTLRENGEGGDVE